MDHKNNSARIARRIAIASVVMIVLAIASADAVAHGPKGHVENPFTPLEALKTGVVLYDRLVAEGKLGESWETSLTRVEVNRGHRDGRAEYVVRFDREKGAPPSVFIFFDHTGAYTGSNFTGR